MKSFLAAREKRLPPLRVPKRRIARYFLKPLEERRSIVRSGGDVAAAQLCTMPGRAHDSHNISEREKGLVSPRLKPRPVSRVLFRPEEMDAASGQRPVFRPSAQRYINVPADFSRSPAFYDAVTHDNAQGLAAIQTGRIDLNRCPRKYPADRQGFKASLSEPFLLSVDGYTVLRGQVVERCE